MDTVIYHNARCSKSRGALSLLQENGVEPQVVNYLETPLDAATIASLLEKLQVPATSLIRFKESLAKDLGLSPDDDRSEQAWCKLLAEHPSLLERPIVVRGERAAIGRPPEKVLTILK